MNNYSMWKAEQSKGNQAFKEGNQNQELDRVTLVTNKKLGQE